MPQVCGFNGFECAVGSHGVVEALLGGHLRRPQGMVGTVHDMCWTGCSGSHEHRYSSTAYVVVPGEHSRVDLGGRGASRYSHAFSDRSRLESGSGFFKVVHGTSKPM